MHQDKTQDTSGTMFNSIEERYYKLESKTAANSFNNNDDYTSIREYLEQLQFEDKLPFHLDVLQFWKNKSYKCETLAKIAEIALAVPATQVSVERAFSALPIVLTKHRRNLSSDNLEHILLLKLNPSVVEIITLE